MSKAKTTLLAIGGGEFAEAKDILEEISGFFKNKSDSHLTVMTVATNEPEAAADKYPTLFKKIGVKKVSVVDVSEREDAFNESSLKKISESDALFFTGGDQLNVTSLLGGSPLHNLIHDKYVEGFIIIGTSAGAMMMSNSMIISGRNDIAPQVGGVEIAPGMDLVSSTIIDTHFTQRGRHGRLLTAIAHYPQDLGIGIDEQTAVLFRNGGFEVLGKGVVTIIDGSQMKHSNLPYRRDDELLGLVGVQIDVLPVGYKYDLKKREPITPNLKHFAGATNEE